MAAAAGDLLRAQNIEATVRMAGEGALVVNNLLLATACAESGGRADAVREEPGYAGDEATPQRVSPGLMQTLIGTAREALGDPSLDRARLLDPAVSLLAGAAVIRRLLDHGDWTSDADFRLFYNINFPPVPAASVRGTRVVRQGRRQGTNFSVVPYTAPNGRRFMWAAGGAQNAPAQPGTDVAVNLDGFISVTPMRADLTCHASLSDLAGLFEDTPRRTEAS